MFPYTTYSKIQDGEIYTYEIIFINSQFVKLSFEEKSIEKKVGFEKNYDLTILVKHAQRAYSKQFAQIDIKIYDKEQNKLNDFYQNYGFISNVNI